MDFIKEEKKFSFRNLLRTKLLILANNEILRIKKTNKTQINSRNLCDFEKFYSDLTQNNAIELKEEKFVSRSLTDVIQKNNFKEKFICKSPDEKITKFSQSKENSIPIEKVFRKKSINENELSEDIRKFNVENTDLSQEKIFNNLETFLNNKCLISQRKNIFFKLKTLKDIPQDESQVKEVKKKSEYFVKNKIDYDKNLQLINYVDLKYQKLPQTKKRNREGLKYLNKLANSLKIIYPLTSKSHSNIKSDELTKVIKGKKGKEIFSKQEELKILDKNANSTYKTDSNNKKDCNNNYILKLNNQDISIKEETHVVNQTNNLSVNTKNSIHNNPNIASNNLKEKNFEIISKDNLLNLRRNTLPIMEEASIKFNKNYLNVDYCNSNYKNINEDNNKNNFLRESKTEGNLLLNHNSKTRNINNLNETNDSSKISMSKNYSQNKKTKLLSEELHLEKKENSITGKFGKINTGCKNLNCSYTNNNIFNDKFEKVFLPPIKKGSNISKNSVKILNSINEEEENINLIIKNKKKEEDSKNHQNIFNLSFSKSINLRETNFTMNSKTETNDKNLNKKYLLNEESDRFSFNNLSQDESSNISRSRSGSKSITSSEEDTESENNYLIKSKRIENSTCEKSYSNKANKNHIGFENKKENAKENNQRSFKEFSYFENDPLINMNLERKSKENINKKFMSSQQLKNFKFNLKKENKISNHDLINATFLNNSKQIMDSSMLLKNPENIKQNKEKKQGNKINKILNINENCESENIQGFSMNKKKNQTNIINDDTYLFNKDNFTNFDKYGIINNENNKYEMIEISNKLPIINFKGFKDYFYDNNNEQNDDFNSTNKKQNALNSLTIDDQTSRNYNDKVSFLKFDINNQENKEIVKECSLNCLENEFNNFDFSNQKTKFLCKYKSFKLNKKDDIIFENENSSIIYKNHNFDDSFSCNSNGNIKGKRRNYFNKSLDENLIENLINIKKRKKSFFIELHSCNSISNERNTHEKNKLNKGGNFTHNYYEKNDFIINC